MTLQELLPILRDAKHDSLIVTGPQRSGTTIASRILATELGMRYVDEDLFGVDDAYRVEIILKVGGVVLQAPGLSHVAHLFYCPVVMMRRPVEDIVASQARIEWNDNHELQKYGFRRGVISAIKYRRWDIEQKELCVNYDLDYDSMEGHPLWVEKERRANFESRQWFEIIEIAEQEETHDEAPLDI